MNTCASRSKQGSVEMHEERKFIGNNNTEIILPASLNALQLESQNDVTQLNIITNCDNGIQRCSNQTLYEIFVVSVV